MAKTAKRGRPKGSKNVYYETVESYPGACPRCGSMDLMLIPGAKTIYRTITGTSKSGDQYDAVKWERKKCKNCDQVVGVNSPQRLKYNNGKPIISHKLDSTLLCESE